MSKLFSRFHPEHELLLLRLVICSYLSIQWLIQMLIQLPSGAALVQ